MVFLIGLFSYSIEISHGPLAKPDVLKELVIGLRFSDRFPNMDAFALQAIYHLVVASGNWSYAYK